MLEKIAKEIKGVLDNDIIVEFDENKMMNFKTLDILNKIVIYLEEYRSGEYNTNSYGLARYDNLNIYIYYSGNGHPLNAAEREIKRNGLEENVIKPLLRYYGDRLSNVRYNVSASRFNTLEVGISLTCNIREEICD